MSDAALELNEPSTTLEPPEAPPLERLRLRVATPEADLSMERGVPLLAEDRGLAAAVPQEHSRRLTHLLRASVVKVPLGTWRPDELQMEQDGSMGLLVLDGFLTRSLAFGTRTSAEVLGPGDLLRPWDFSGDDGVCVRTAAHWRVWEPARVALIDWRVTTLAGRSPQLTAELTSRLVRRVRMLAVLLALTQVRQLPQRVLLAMWTLAERWGRVTPDGVLLTVPLTHATLAQLAGASRPSVTNAVAELRAEGLVSSTDNHGWLLRGEAPADVGSGLH